MLEVYISKPASKLNNRHHNNPTYFPRQLFSAVLAKKSSLFFRILTSTPFLGFLLHSVLRAFMLHYADQSSELFPLHPNPLLITSKAADETPEQTLHTSCFYTRVMSDEGPLNFWVVSDLFLLDWQCSYTPFVVLKSTNYLIIRAAVIVINAAVKGQMMRFDMSWWKHREFLWDRLSGSCLDEEGLLEGLG